MDFFLKTYGVFATIPILSFFLLYFLFISLNISKKSALNYAIYITTVFLISATSSQIKVIFGFEYGLWLILIWVLLIFSTLGLLQWKIKGYLKWKKILFSTLKLTFFSLSFFYIIFFIIGYITR